MADKGGYLIPTERVDNAILELHGQKVILDYDLAVLYGVTTRRLKEQVRRNRDRFPDDFLFELTLAEMDELVAKCDRLAALKHSSTPPFAFTEHGAVMAASVLKSKRAVEVNVFVVRAFVRMRRMLADQRQFALKLAEIEARLSAHDGSLKVVFDAIRQLMQPPPAPKRRKIGFATDPDDNITTHDRPSRQHRRR